MKEVEAIILAGGRGYRMDQLGVETQKCLLPIEGRPVIASIMDNLVNCFGSVDLKIAVAYKSEDVKRYVDRNRPEKIEVTYVPHIEGTEGWGIYRDMRPHIKGKFVALPGDILALPKVYESAFLMFNDNPVEASLSLSPAIHEAITHGVGRLEDGRVVELRWPPPEHITKGWLRDMTIWASDPNFFDLIERYPSEKKSIGYVFMQAVEDGHQIAGNYYGDPWIHLEKVEDLSRILS